MLKTTVKLEYENDVQVSRATDGAKSYMYTTNGYRRQSLADVVANAEAFVPDANQQYVYGFRDAFAMELTINYIQLPYPPSEVLHMLIAYLQFTAYELFDHYAMVQDDLCTLLTTFYGARVISDDEVRVFETKETIYFFDCSENWDMHCGMLDEVMSIKSFHREGLKEMIEKLIAQYQD